MSYVEAVIEAKKFMLAKRIISDARRVVILNALPLNAIQYRTFSIRCVRFANVSALRELEIGKEVVNYVRHESTIKILSKLLDVELKPSASLYEYRDRDALVIVTLKKPIRGQEVEAKEEDLECFVCEVIGGL